MEINKTIKYEHELDSDFPSWVSSAPGGEYLWQCIQCGTCSGSCPLSIYMDYTPRRIIAMSRAGFKEDVLKSTTIWLCASCYACTVQCPQEIQLTDLMYLFKQRAIKEGKHPKRFTIPILSKEFFNMVWKRGRTTESFLVAKMFLKTNPLKLFNMTSLGLKLLRYGRMTLGLEAMKNKKELRTILKASKEES